VVESTIAPARLPVQSGARSRRNRARNAANGVKEARAVCGDPPPSDYSDGGLNVRTRTTIRVLGT
jgi:hypothetical protein